VNEKIDIELRTRSDGNGVRQRFPRPSLPVPWLRGNMQRALITIGLALAAACGDKVVQVKPPDTSLMVCIGDPTVNPLTATLHPGDTLRLHAMASAGCTPITTQWRWRSSDTLIAKVDSLGLVLARRQGIAAIIAEAVVDPAIKGAAAITVTP
jgi:hypothetical protein